MKIVYITEFPIPAPYANCLHSLKMCDAFAGLGVDLLMLAPLSDRAVSVDIMQIKLDYDLHNVFQVKHLPSRMPGGRVYRYAFSCYRLLHRMRPDLVFTISAACGLAAVKAGIPVIFEGHETIGGRIRRPLLQALLHHKRFLSLVTVSSALKEHFVEEHGVHPERIYVARNAADEAKALAPSEYRSRLAVGYAGSLGADVGRGIDLIVHIAERMPDIDFHLYGGSAGQVSYWKKKSSAPNLTFHGHVSLRQVKQELAGMDILVAPYQRAVILAGGVDSSRYMSPMKVFDYMAQGKAIVASRLPAIEEVLTDGQDALLCDPADGDAWVAAIDSLSHDQQLRTALGEAAHREFMMRYRWQVRAEEILKHAEMLPQREL